MIFIITCGAIFFNSVDRTFTGLLIDRPSEHITQKSEHKSDRPIDGVYERKVRSPVMSIALTSKTIDNNSIANQRNVKYCPILMATLGEAVQLANIYLHKAFLF
ncbi:hypothetical protein QT970_05360 [Microcoleus sp. herbarium8]|uniref:hypothetical protein n=1 Tax=Microcoleus sp. herbarium8 TaxID=3055436 RepID=UPI002FD2F1E1